MLRVFISYSRQDEMFARRIAKSLSDLGVDVWIDVEDIPPGMRWSSAIQQGLDICDVMLVLISPDSMSSSNVEDEYHYYLDVGKPVIGALLKPTRLSYRLIRKSIVHFYNREYNGAFAALFDELRLSSMNSQFQRQFAAPNAQDPTVPSGSRNTTRSARTESAPVKARRRVSMVGVVSSLVLGLGAGVAVSSVTGLLQVNMLMAIINHAIGPMAPGTALSGAAVPGVKAPDATLVPTEIVFTAVPSLPSATPEGRDLIARIVSDVYFRGGPGTDYDAFQIIGGGMNGVVIAQDSTRNWYLLRNISGDLGWVSAKYVILSNYDTAIPVIMGDESLIIASDSLVYAAPDSTMPVIGTVSAGTFLPRVDRVRNADGSVSWYEVVLPDGQWGWVAAGSAGLG